MRKGFTLVEILLAVIVSSLLLVAASTILVNYSELYLMEQTRPSYDQHASNVSRYIEQAFMNAVSSKVVKTGENDPEDPGETEYGASKGTTNYSELPGAGYGDDKYLNYENDKDIPIIKWEESEILPRMQVYLYFEEGEGLFFVWQTEEQKQEEPDDMQISLISPFVKALHYQYYNEEDDDWEEEISFLDEKEQSDRQIPDMIKLDFEWPDKRTMTTTVIMPPNVNNVPVY